MQWLFGSQFLGEAALLGQYSLAMLLLALVNVWAQYFIAVQETRYAWLLLGASVIQLAVLFLVPLSLNGVVWWLIVCNAGLVLAGEWLLRYRKSA
jgi:O-antigen/teichoic acid export membrane protein